MKIQLRTLALIAASLCTACSAPDDPTPPADHQTASESARARNQDAQTRPGSISFSVDGEPKHFDYISGDHTFYTTVASKIHGQASGRSSETVTVILSNVNLKKLDYPIELPLPRDAIEPSQAMMAMITIGFGYTDGEDNEWGGSGRIKLESLLPNGTLSGSFSNVSLPHVDKQLPNVVLTDGRFAVRMDMP